MSIGYIWAIVLVVLSGIVGCASAILRMPMLHLIEIPLIGLAIFAVVFTYLRERKRKQARKA